MRTIRISHVLAAGDEEGNLMIRGRTDSGPVEIVMPGDAAAVLAVQFTASASSLHGGIARNRLVPVFQVSGYELMEPQEGTADLLLTCAPGMTVPFALPTAALLTMSEAFAEAHRKSLTQAPRGH